MMKFNSFIKVLHFSFDMIILLSILFLLLFDIFKFLKYWNDIRGEIIPLSFILFSFFILLYCFIKNILNDYKNNLGIRSILRFITYCLLLIGFILRKNHLSNEIYQIMGYFSLFTFILNFFFGFYIGDSISEEEKLVDTSKYSINFQLQESRRNNK